MKFDKNEWYKITYNKYILCIRKDDEEVNKFIKDLCKSHKFTSYVYNKIKEDIENQKEKI